MQPTHMASRPSERLGVLFPGMGAVATTTIAGVMLARRGLAPPVGSLTQLGSLRVDGSSAEVPVRDALALTPLDSLVFGAWDLFGDNAYEVAVNARVLEDKHLDIVRDELSQVRPMTAAFYPEYVRRLRAEIPSIPNARQPLRFSADLICFGNAPASFTSSDAYLLHQNWQMWMQRSRSTMRRGFTDFS